MLYSSFFTPLQQQMGIPGIDSRKASANHARASTAQHSTTQHSTERGKRKEKTNLQQSAKSGKRLGA